jgi:hypothetical protein
VLHSERQDGMSISRIVTGIVFVFAATAAITALGAMAALSVAELSGTAGFNALDIFLGGTVVGLGVGLIVSLTMALRLCLTHLRWSIVAALGGAALAVLLAWIIGAAELL